jgi:hypothetical protein
MCGGDYTLILTRPQRKEITGDGHRWHRHGSVNRRTRRGLRQGFGPGTEEYGQVCKSFAFPTPMKRLQLNQLSPF